MISCFPVLPRLFQVYGPRVHSAFLSRSKTNGISSSESQISNSILVPVDRKKSYNGAVDLHDSCIKNNGTTLPFQGPEPIQPEQQLTKENIDDVRSRDQIWRTTRIEIKQEPRGTTKDVSHPDLERQW